MLLLSASAAFASAANAELRAYDLTIKKTTVNYSGKSAMAMVIEVPGKSSHNKVHAPVIEATEGDLLRSTFCNEMDVETSIHWHGVLLPNDQDGVPYLTTLPIKAGECFTYEFPVIQSGTYWYHSHTGLQEQQGLHGGIVFHPKGGEVYSSDKDVTLVLSDWTDENPEKVFSNLKRDDDYYAWKKGSVQSWRGALSNGWGAVKSRIDGAKNRMPPMDISDVGYDAFLVNGEKELDLPDINGRDKVRLRVVNGGTSTYFNVNYGCGDLTIVGADGKDTKPLKVKRQRIAVAETFDFMVTVPEGKSCEFRATAQDGTGYSSAFLGQGALVTAPTIARPNLYLVGHAGHSGHDMSKTGKAGKKHDMSKMNHKMSGMKGMDHSKMDHSMHRDHMNHEMKMSPKAVVMNEYEGLRALKPTTLPRNNLWAPNIELRMTGTMRTYDWSFDNIKLSEADPIVIHKGENIRVVLENETMMSHPFHLHGHFFRVVNGQGDYAPLKHTVNIPAGQTVTVEFEATEDKDWIAHCHILYHAQAGMGRVFHYAGSEADTSLLEARKTNPLLDDSRYFAKGEVAIQTHKSTVELEYSNTHNLFDFESAWNNSTGNNLAYEIEAYFVRKVTPFFSPYVGIGVEQERGENRGNIYGVFGVRYTLPYLVELDAQGRLSIKGKPGFEFSFSNEHQLSDNLSATWAIGAEMDPGEGVTPEGSVSLKYRVNKALSLTAGCDTQFGNQCGGGFKLNFQKF